MRFSRLILLVGVVGLISWPIRSWAAEINTDWQHAISLGKDPMVVSSFGQLSGAGSARFFKFSVTSSTSLIAKVDVDTSAGSGLSPRLVLYTPDQMTVGPALPMMQPPSTLAAVYPASGTDVTHEGPWLAALTHSITSPVDVASAGTYYVAVYNAGKNGGAFRFTLQRSTVNGASFSSRMRTWWNTGVWVGPQPITYVLPVSAAFIAGLIWYVVHRLPHPAHRRRQYAKK